MSDEKEDRLQEFAEDFTDMQLLADGRGAQVYRARQPFLDRAVALKIVWMPQIASEIPLTEHLRIEGAALAAVSHPNLVHLHHGGITSSGHSYLVMELLEGSTLARRLEEAGPLQPRLALDVAIAVADALRALHAKGILHADVCPSNIIVTNEGTIKLIDLGLARVSHLRGTPQPREPLSPRRYLCPRYVATGDAHPSVDVYALGVTLHSMLFGLTPEECANRAPTDSSTTVRARGAQGPDALRFRGKVSDSLATVLERATATDPLQRYATMEELLTALREQRAALTPVCGRAPIAEPPSTFASRTNPDAASDGDESSIAGEATHAVPTSDAADDRGLFDSAHHSGVAVPSASDVSSAAAHPDATETRASGTLPISDSMALPLARAVGSDVYGLPAGLEDAFPRPASDEEAVRAILQKLKSLSRQGPAPMATRRSRFGISEESRTFLKDAKAIQRALGSDADTPLPEEISIDRLLDAYPTLTDALPVRRSGTSPAPASVASMRKDDAKARQDRRPDRQLPIVRKASDCVQLDLRLVGEVASEEAIPAAALPEPRGTLLLFPRRRSEPAPPPILRKPSDLVHLDLAVCVPPESTVDAQCPSQTLSVRQEASGSGHQTSSQTAQVFSFSLTESRNGLAWLGAASLAAAAGFALVLGSSLPGAKHADFSVAGASATSPIAERASAPPMTVVAEPAHALAPAPPEDAAAPLQAQEAPKPAAQTHAAASKHVAATPAASRKCPPGLYPPACLPLVRDAVRAAAIMPIVPAAPSSGASARPPSSPPGRSDRFLRFLRNP